MNQAVGYLREVLSNYTEGYPVGQMIYDKVKNIDFKSEQQFARALSEQEINFLHNILPDEIQHAHKEQDFERAHQLNAIYEQMI
ncbi:sigma-G-dependent sporulation-specific acid-soluble spore protein CsgA [Cytobacillus spongiae]|jgi:hypothetical protein|uniref:sigma-G-dependent sporulation-specific acid-soluble spore protein CsgA n=1 Tax=Cytobacillus spongiae TaxID=2901381 RepID=UPI001F423889|nr:sigma-G-dependent sporulation-specific acid-soluble spore protein CsgA [Cytobacillus spongiae]UII57777.1 sigma-G-dependent sporulation-specific acid-soluble spore protein CsgA [Cytobacillus spongiae]